MSADLPFLKKIEDIVKIIPQIELKTPTLLTKKNRFISAIETATILNCNAYDITNCSLDNNEWDLIYKPIAKKLLKDRNQEIVAIINLGLAMHPQINDLVASPDGLVIVNDNGTMRLWLVEINCSYKKHLTENVPYNYWVKIQTQLYVWTELFKIHELTLDGCIYSVNQFEEISTEIYNQFTNDHELNNDKNLVLQIGSNEQPEPDHHYFKLVKHWEKRISLDNDFFQIILPEITGIYRHIDEQQVNNDIYHTNDLLCQSFNDLEKFTYAGLLTKAKVVDVYDGDTITIVFYHNGFPVKDSFRMLGYDSPEMKPRKNIENRDLHMQAAQIVRNKLVSCVGNKLVWVKFTKEEKYGRLMGEIFTVSPNSENEFNGDEHNINAWMISEGFGKSYVGGHKEEFTESELRKIIGNNH